MRRSCVGARGPVDEAVLAFTTLSPVHKEPTDRVLATSLNRAPSVPVDTRRTTVLGLSLTARTESEFARRSQRQPAFLVHQQEMLLVSAVVTLP